MQLWDVYIAGQDAPVGIVEAVSGFAALEEAYKVWGYGADLRVFLRG